MKAQIEVLRKMLLAATVEDIRVVLLRLASRTQTLRLLRLPSDDLRVQVARETLNSIPPGQPTGVGVEGSWRICPSASCIRTPTSAGQDVGREAD